MNTLIKKILFATDLSDTARNAFNYAVALADRFESELIVVHVIKKDTAYTAGIVRMGLGEDLYKDMEQKKAQSARDLLIGKRTEAHVFGEQIHQYCTEAEQGLKRSKPLKVTDMVIEAPSISEEIMKLVDGQACDLIVLGHRKHHLLAGDLGEGTLKKVLKLATIPVMLVPAPKAKA